MKRFLSFIFVGFLGISTLIPTAAQADYPYDRPINVIIPFGAGGSCDITARIIADYLLEKHKIQMNVINKPGGSQAVAMNDTLRARPDGYTVVYPTFSAIATTPKLANVGYSQKDFKPVAQLINLEATFVVPTNSSANSLPEFIDLAMKNPEETVYATTGAISYQRLLTAQILKRFYNDAKIRHVAYASNHEVSTAALGKHVSMANVVPSTAIPYLKSGDFKALAVVRKERHPDMPEVPTLREIFKDQLTEADNAWIEIGSWGGFLVSSKVGDDKVQALNTLLKEALSDPGVQEKFIKVGVLPEYLPPAEFGQVVTNSSQLVDNILQGRKTID